MPVHEEEVDARAIAVLARPASVTLVVAWAGLPANAAQGVALVVGQFVPAVTRGMPELMEQAMFRGNQPRFQRRVEQRTFAGFREPLLDRDETVFDFRQGQRPVEP